MFWIHPKLKCFHTLSQLKQIIWDWTKHLIQTETNKTYLIMSASQSQKAIKKKKNTSCPWPHVPKVVILLCLDQNWLAGNPRTAPMPALGTWGSRAGFCRNSAGCMLWTLRKEKKGASCGQHCLPGSVTSDMFSLRELLSDPSCELLSEFPLLSFWVTVLVLDYVKYGT